MGEHVLLFCLLGLVLTVTIIVVIAPWAVTGTLPLLLQLHSLFQWLL
jgi:hypothetical protein